MSVLADSWLMAATGSRVKEFYSAIGVNLRGEGAEASVSCFANPGAHANGDRNASCSVNALSGLFKCHGCGVQGNAYAAAIACGYTSQRAQELARSFGLYLNAEPADEKPKPRLPDERQIQKWKNALCCSVLVREKRGNTLTLRVPEYQGTPEQAMSRSILSRLYELKGWTPGAIVRCSLGWDGDRIVFTVRDKALKKVGVLRYRPNDPKKMLAMPGTKRGLFPAPETLSRKRPLFLVEGETKVVSLSSVGLQAVAIPGASSWRMEHAARLWGFRITMIVDCDSHGRQLGEQVKRAMPQVKVVDPDSSRDDKYDVSDFILEAMQVNDTTSARRVLERLAA